MPLIFRRLAAPALLFVICAGFYWKLTLTSQYTWLDGPDIANLDAPRLQFIATELHHKHFPLWDPHHWMGQPFLGQFTGVAYPLNWLLGLAPLNKDGKLTQGAFNWYFVLIRYLGGLFCYLLCQDLKRTRTASIVAACVFMFGGFIGTTDWPEVINGIIWAPLVFLFLLRAQRGERPYPNAALSGMFLGISWLAGHHELPIYFSLAAAGVWLWAAIEARRNWPRVAGLAAVAFLFTFLTGAFQTLSGYEFGKQAVRWAGVEQPLSFKEAVPYIVHTQYALTPVSILGIAFNGLARHVNPFIGLIALALAVTGTVLCWRRREARILSLVCLLSLLFAMAANNVLHGILYAVLPVFGKARLPARMVGVFGFAVAPLVAYGFDQLTQSLESNWYRRLIWTLSGLGAAIFLITFALAMAGRFDFNQPYVITALLALLAAATLEAWRRGVLSRRVALLVLPLLVLVELGNGGLDFPNSYDKTRGANAGKLTQNRDIIAFLRQQPGPNRLNYDDHQLSINLGDWEGIDTAGGFTAAVSANMVGEERHLKRTSDLMAVNYSLAREPYFPGQKVLFQGESGLKLMSNPDAFPRAWAVHQVRTFATSELLVPRLQDPETDLRRTALITGKAPALQLCDATPDQVAYLGGSVNNVRVEARLGCRGIVVVADTYFPGWRATVDGKPVPIFEAYGAIRGIVVEGGAHHIEFRYQPASAIAGGLMSLCGLLGAVAWAAWPRRRRA